MCKCNLHMWLPGVSLYVWLTEAFYWTRISNHQKLCLREKGYILIFCRLFWQCNNFSLENWIFHFRVMFVLWASSSVLWVVLLLLFFFIIMLMCVTNDDYMFHKRINFLFDWLIMAHYGYELGAKPVTERGAAQHTHQTHTLVIAFVGIK